MESLLGRCILLLQSVVLTIIVSAPFDIGLKLDEVQNHLNEFSNYSVAHHDNIDDSSEIHSHVHKHSEDGEEHEHDHSHDRVSDISQKTFFASKPIAMATFELETSQGITESNLNSNPHPSSIFRPPIYLYV